MEIRKDIPALAPLPKDTFSLNNSRHLLQNNSVVLSNASSPLLICSSTPQVIIPMNSPLFLTSALPPVKQNNQNVMINGQIVQCQHVGFIAKPPFGSTVQGNLKILTSFTSNETKQNSNHKPFTLEEWNRNANILSVNIKLFYTCPFIKDLIEAISNIILSGVLVDWLLLKCEATKKPFDCIDEEVIVFSVNSLRNVTEAVHKNSCLPLPLVREGQTLYFFLSFGFGNNPRIGKLNNFLSKKIELVSDVLAYMEKDRTIKMFNAFEKRFEQFVFYPIRELEDFVIACKSEITRLLEEKINWGFLQIWVRNVVKEYNGTFTAKHIAERLTIETVQELSTVKLNEYSYSSSIEAFKLGQCYNRFFVIRFSPTFIPNLTKKKFSVITMLNTETLFVSKLPLVQFYRQYFFNNNRDLSVLLDQITRQESRLSNEVPASNERFVFSVQPKTYFENSAAKNDLGRNKSYECPVQPKCVPPSSVIKNDLVKKEPNKSSVRSKSVFESSATRKDVVNNEYDESFRDHIIRYRDRIKRKLRSPLHKLRRVDASTGTLDLSCLVTTDAESLAHKHCITILQFLKKGEMNPAEVREKLFPLIRTSLDNCYALNAMNFTKRDECLDGTFIKNCFNNAIAFADKTKTFSVFLEEIFKFLQYHFTDATCRKIMDLMIYTTLVDKYNNIIKNYQVSVLPLEEHVPQKRAQEEITLEDNYSSMVGNISEVSILPANHHVPKKRAEEEIILLDSYSSMVGNSSEVSILPVNHHLPKKRAEEEIILLDSYSSMVGNSSEVSILPPNEHFPKKRAQEEITLGDNYSRMVGNSSEVSILPVNHHLPKKRAEEEIILLDSYSSMVGNSSEVSIIPPNEHFPKKRVQEEITLEDNYSSMVGNSSVVSILPPNQHVPKKKAQKEIEKNGSNNPQDVVDREIRRFTPFQVSFGMKEVIGYLNLKYPSGDEKISSSGSPKKILVTLNSTIFEPDLNTMRNECFSYKVSIALLQLRDLLDFDSVENLDGITKKKRRKSKVDKTTSKIDKMQPKNKRVVVRLKKEVRIVKKIFLDGIQTALDQKNQFVLLDAMTIKTLHETRVILNSKRRRTKSCAKKCLCLC